MGEERPREGHREAPQSQTRSTAPATLLPPETAWGHSGTWAFSSKMNLLSDPFLRRGGWVAVVRPWQRWAKAGREPPPRRPQAGLSRGGNSPGHAHHARQPARGVGTSTTHQPAASCCYNVKDGPSQESHQATQPHVGRAARGSPPRSVRTGNSNPPPGVWAEATMPTEAACRPRTGRPGTAWPVSPEQSSATLGRWLWWGVLSTVLVSTHPCVTITSAPRKCPVSSGGRIRPRVCATSAGEPGVPCAFLSGSVGAQGLRSRPRT